MLKNNIKTLFSFQNKWQFTITLFSVVVIVLSLIVYVKSTNAFEQERSITIDNDGSLQTVVTTAATVDEILQEAAINVSEQDEVSPSLSEKVGKHTTITIRKAFRITLDDAGRKYFVWSTSTTVADFLTENEISLSKMDRMNKKLDDVIFKNDILQIVRVEKITDVVEAESNFATETRKDKSLKIGQQKIMQEGKKGKVLRTVEIVKENGIEVKRTTVEEKILVKPMNKIVAEGAKSNTVAVSRNNSLTVGQTLVVTATAYTAYCNGCSGTTALGINLRENPDLKVIAVDPSIIPLGTKVWVEGYGYAIAADTGGAIKGNKIDVFMPSNNAALSFGRRTVTIKILQ